MGYKPRGPFQVRFWSTLDGQEPTGWASVDVGGDMDNLDAVRRRVRAVAKDSENTPGLYVIVARGDVPCVGFEARDVMATKRVRKPARDLGNGMRTTGEGTRLVADPDAPPVRQVRGSNLSWCR